MSSTDDFVRFIILLYRNERAHIEELREKVEQLSSDCDFYKDLSHQRQDQINELKESVPDQSIENGECLHCLKSRNGYCQVHCNHKNHNGERQDLVRVICICAGLHIRRCNICGFMSKEFGECTCKRKVLEY